MRRSPFHLPSPVFPKVKYVANPHSQWGHCIVLHAAYLNPFLRHLIDPHELREVTVRVRQFLVEAAQPSSALADDIRILDYAAQRSGLMPAVVGRREMNRSFSSMGEERGRV